MAFNLSTLEDYVKEHNLPLLKKSLFGSRTAALLGKQTGIKSAAALNLFDTDANFQTGTCEFSPSGSTTFTQRELKVADITVQEALCPRDLEKKWTQYEVVAGSAPDQIPFEQDYTERKADRVARNLEVAIWQGDTDSTDGNLNKFDGLAKTISGSAAFIDATAVVTEVSVTKANVVSIVDAIYESIPSDVINEGDIHIFMSDTNYRKYTMALRDENNFNYAPDGAQLDYPYPIDGRVTVSAVPGLNGSDEMFAGRASHMVIGVDLEGEDENFELWYSQDNRQVRFAMDFKYGVQVAFPEQIVYWVPSA